VEKKDSRDSRDGRDLRDRKEEESNLLRMNYSRQLLLFGLNHDYHGDENFMPPHGCYRNGSSGAKIV
jgi:hypothetical protein